MTNTSNLHITKHAVERFVERTDSPMALEHAKALVTGLLTQFKESDLIQWNERSLALRSLFGLFIITAGHVVTFLAWTDLPPKRRKLLQDLVLGF